jgi:hypothetical protein
MNTVFTPLASTSRFTVVGCPFGDLLVVTDDGTALTRLWLPPAIADPGWERADDLPNSIFRWHLAAPRFSARSGRRCAASITAAPRRTGRLRWSSGRRELPGLWALRITTTRSPSCNRATG